MTAKLHCFETNRNSSEGQLFRGYNVIFLIILSVKIYHFAIKKIRQSRMPISLWFSFAELEDMKMKKKNETGDGESWKNNDFPICKTIVRFALHRQHPLFVSSFARSVVGLSRLCSATF